MNSDANNSKEGGFLPDISNSGRSNHSRKSGMVDID